MLSTDTLTDSVKQCVGLSLSVIAGEGCCDGSVHLLSGAVAGEVNGGRSYLLPLVGRAVEYGDKLVLHVLRLGVGAGDEVDDTHRVRSWIGG